MTSRLLLSKFLSAVRATMAFTGPRREMLDGLATGLAVSRRSTQANTRPCGRLASPSKVGPCSGSNILVLELICDRDLLNHQGRTSRREARPRAAACSRYSVVSVMSSSARRPSSRSLIRARVAVMPLAASVRSRPGCSEGHD